jgi:hypothetical protein
MCYNKSTYACGLRYLMPSPITRNSFAADIPAIAIFFVRQKRLFIPALSEIDRKRQCSSIPILAVSIIA